MGQAKRRGTFEERKAAAMARQADKQKELDMLADLAYNERQKLRPAENAPFGRRSRLSPLLAIAALASMMPRK